MLNVWSRLLWQKNLCGYIDTILLPLPPGGVSVGQGEIIIILSVVSCPLYAEAWPLIINRPGPDNGRWSDQDRPYTAFL